jgi:hypothetical protein
MVLCTVALLVFHLSGPPLLARRGVLYRNFGVEEWWRRTV